MKAVIRFFAAILVVFSCQSQAQVINSITMDPPNPNETDTISFYINIDFPSGPCNDKTINTTATPPNLFADALHCLGMLTFICNYTDTVTYYQLPAGNYSFTFQVDAGGAPSPCTPGIVPGPSQTLNFVVFPVNSINETVNTEVKIFPNPADKLITIDSKEIFIEYIILNNIGDVVSKGELNHTNSIDVSSLKKGIYFIELKNKNAQVYKDKLIIN